MSPKPAYDALKELIKRKWWTGELKLTTDQAGRVRFRGFLGDYAVESPKGTAEFKVGKAGRVRTTARLHE
jgi:endo-1,4-beta-xylanase